jgi:5-methylcytosine-specific restriction endonuclease McrA
MYEIRTARDNSQPAQVNILRRCCMQDSTANASSSPQGGLKLPVEECQIAAAREMHRENKGAQWSICFSIGIQVGDNVELRNNLIPLLMEFDVPTATISDMFDLSGREVWDIAASEPVSLYWCPDCHELLDVRDRRDLMRLRRASSALSCARPKDPGDTTLLCDSCTNLRLQLHSEEQRLIRLARQARSAQLRKMPFAQYRMQPEWQARRTATLARAGYRCQACAEGDVRLDVHHNTYERYGDESTFDLVVLCEQCHDLFHGIVEDAS